jgi:hypothetical protein
MKHVFHASESMRLKIYEILLQRTFSLQYVNPELIEVFLLSLRQDKNSVSGLQDLNMELRVIFEGSMIFATSSASSSPFSLLFSIVRLVYIS